jgi:hypothetical protein
MKAFVVGYIRDGSFQGFSVFSERTPSTMGHVYTFVHSEHGYHGGHVDDWSYERSFDEAIKHMDRDARMVREPMSTSSRPLWRLATRDEFVARLKKEH